MPGTIPILPSLRSKVGLSPSPRQFFHNLSADGSRIGFSSASNGPPSLHGHPAKRAGVRILAELVQSEHKPR
jgi:hypothetical protein